MFPEDIYTPAPRCVQQAGHSAAAPLQPCIGAAGSAPAQSRCRAPPRCRSPPTARGSIASRAAFLRVRQGGRSERGEKSERCQRSERSRTRGKGGLTRILRKVGLLVGRVRQGCREGRVARGGREGGEARARKGQRARRPGSSKSRSFFLSFFQRARQWRRLRPPILRAAATAAGGRVTRGKAYSAPSAALQVTPSSRLSAPT